MKGTITKTKTRVSTKVKVAVAVGAAASAIAAAGFWMVLIRMVPVFALAVASPSGTTIPGNIEVFRYTIEAQRIDVEVSRTMFEINSTDNAGSLWNTCDQLGDTSKWSVYDSGGNRVDAPGGWTFYNEDLRACSGSEIVKYAKAIFPSTIYVPSGLSEEHSLYLDTFGASAAHDDALFVQVPNVGVAVEWTDDRGVIRGARGMRSLPVIGNALIF